MQPSDKVNILLVDDQEAKLLSYEVILRGLDVNLIKANSATEALQQLLKAEVAVVLVDVCMPDLDGFQLAEMIREHPRFQHTAIIFISAVLLAEVDHLRGYEMGAVDYVPVPVVPQVLRAKVKVFAELYRKTRQLEQLNRDLEKRVADRTAELEASTLRLLQSEERRSFALAASRMGSWDWDVARGTCIWDEGQCRIFGVDSESFVPTLETIGARVHWEDWNRLQTAFAEASSGSGSYQTEVRVIRAGNEMRWCIAAAAGTLGPDGKLVRLSGVTIDITDRKEAEERQLLLAREVDHRARNMLAVVQAIVRLTRANTTPGYIAAVEGRIQALAQTHNLLAASRWTGADIAGLVNEELAPYRNESPTKIIASGPYTKLPPDKAQTIALALHELATNAAKYGALSCNSGEVHIAWKVESGSVTLQWSERGGPRVEPPKAYGFGTKIINSSVKGQSGGYVNFDWRSEGLRCNLAIPMETNELATQPSRNNIVADNNLVQLKTGGAKRLLLTEDEALVGMMMRDLLTSIGFVVVGPIASLAEAIAVAGSQNFDGAVLDVSMAGELVYPLAEILRNRGIPFVFVSGYGQEIVDPRFGDVAVFQKPIDQEDLGQAVRSSFGANLPASEVSVSSGANAGIV